MLTQLWTMTTTQKFPSLEEAAIALGQGLGGHQEFAGRTVVVGPPVGVKAEWDFDFGSGGGEAGIAASGAAVQFHAVLGWKFMSCSHCH